MTKVKCSKCGYVVKLDEISPQGTEYWEVQEAITFLINGMVGHKCK